MPEKSDPRELKALDAIVAAGLAGQRLEDITDEELLAAIETCPELSAEGHKLLESLGNAPFTKGARNRALEEASHVAEQPAGMYRLGSDENIDPKLQAEIDKKREEIRARLKQRQDKDV